MAEAATAAGDAARAAAAIAATAKQQNATANNAAMDYMHQKRAAVFFLSRCGDSISSYAEKRGKGSKTQMSFFGP